MDSLSQAVLGGMVGVLVTRGNQPRKAIITGALLATLPDLDVLQPFSNDLDATIGHRTWSHSWLVHFGISPVIAAALYRFDRSWNWFTWFTLVLLVLTTHAALDALTIYGTGLFWPLQSQPIMGGSIFIIDPLYTLPLLIAAVMLLRRPLHPRPRMVAGVSVVLSSFYLGWGVMAQGYVERLAVESLQSQGESWSKMVATPTPFNTLLWRVLVLQEDHFFEGFYAFTDSSRDIELHRYPRNLNLIGHLEDQTNIKRFDHFNHGYYSMNRMNDQIIANDLRMGAEPYYFFRFVFADNTGTIGNTNDLGVRPPDMLVPRFANIPINGWHLFSWIGKRLVTNELHPMGQYSGLDAVAAPKAGGI
ncbi:MAG: metal-dependent hydrolase [bacterium]